MKVKKLQVKMDIICGQGKLQIQMRARNGIRQARKGIKADKEWHKSRQGKAQRQARKGTTAGKKRYNGRQKMHKGRQENAQRQEDMKGTNEASKEQGLKGRPGNLKRWAGGQGMTQK